MESLGDAYYLPNHALALLEIASITEDEAARRAMLTLVGAGGGAGTETVGALNDDLRAAKKYYPAQAKDNVRIVLVRPSAFWSSSLRTPA
jgi:NADH dehydrogenase FAD-containing subunit